MLAAFLTCLSVGAMLAQTVDRRLGARALPASLFCTGVALVLSIPLWGKVPNVFVASAQHVTTWSGRELLRAAVAFVILAVPTTLMGLTFPLLLRRVAGRDDVARRVGRLTAVNTLGSIGGSIVAGYVILPALGSEHMLRAIGLCFAACAAVAAGLEVDRRLRGALLASPGLVLLLAMAIPSWDMMVMTNGANVYFEDRIRPEALVMVREDVHGGFTSVTRGEGVHILYTNGKFQGDDGSQMTAQRSFAHYPSLFVDRFGRALVIGLGTGTTLGTVAAYPYERIDVAEISPAIAEAARRFFTAVNHNGLDDPRAVLHVEDGRNFLMFAREPYDLITIELSSVWFAGAANLYSLEFYELCRARLGERGILQQWVQLHHIYRPEVAVMLRTIRTVFPHVALFGAGGQGIVVASMHPLVASRARLKELSQRPAIADTLGGPELEALLDQLIVSGRDLDRFLEENASDHHPLVSTDDNLYLEHATPKGNVLPYFKSLVTMVKLLESYRSRDAVARHLEP
jgi:spermidine synthase